MRTVLRASFQLLSGLALVSACAGRSISRPDGDDPPPSSDDSFGGGSTAGGSTGIGGKGGGSTDTAGGATGEGGAGKAGATGKGGTTGKGGVGGNGGSGATSGAPDDGEGGFGGEGCGPRSPGSVGGVCVAPPGCISMASPINVFIRRNQPAAEGGGLGGEGGASGDDGDFIATAVLCSDFSGLEGLLAFDYYVPESGADMPGVTLFGGKRACRGAIMGDAFFRDFAPPAPGTWTTQCLRVTGDELDTVATIMVMGTPVDNARVKNLRFVTACECPRQITRYTTCGNMTSPRVCQ